MYVIPAEGLTVPDPILRDHLPAFGRDVTSSEYWTRRLADGDVLTSPEAIDAALAAAMKVRDAAKTAVEKAQKPWPAADAPAEVRQAAMDALAGADAALRAAEAIVADITPHAPKPAPRGKE